MTATKKPQATEKKSKDAKSGKGGKKGALPTQFDYHQVKITCACGGEFDAGSTIDTIRVDICSKCHPFFTGTDRILDAEGRVEKFMKKYNRVSPKKDDKKAESK
jgi:large subunit ribosomal protein L31